MTRQCYPYARVSTFDQAREGVSLPAQLARAEAWATANGCHIAESYSDPGISGKRADNRPGLQAALNAACKAKGVLLVYSLSRLARSVPDALAIAKRLEKAGADLVSLTEQIDTTTAAGRLIYVVLAAVAAFERDITAERTAATLAYKRSEWTKYGEVKYGYTILPDPACQKHFGADTERACSCKLAEDPDEQAILTMIRRLRLEGASWPEIAEELNGLEIRTKKGGRWSAGNLRKIAIAEPLVPTG